MHFSRHCKFTLLAALTLLSVGATSILVRTWLGRGRNAGSDSLTELNLNLPEDILISTTKRGPNFALYVFSMEQGGKQRVVMHAYVGSQPSFPLVAPLEGEVEKTSTSYFWRDEQGAKCRESLIELRCRSSPCYLHTWYVGQCDRIAQKLDAILEGAR
jgi:hypothetical protein